MARPRPEAFDKKKIVAENRRARFEYFLEDVSRRASPCKEPR